MLEATTLTSIGPWVLQAVLGSGGMGVVYRAYNERSGLVAALKTVRISQAGRLAQIRREVHALANLNHPGVVQVLDHGVDAGVPWYAMELLEGASLQAVISAAFGRGPSDEGSSGVFPSTHLRAAPASKGVHSPSIGSRSTSELLGIAHRLCEVLAYIHGEGIVHRDLKPANVFITNAGTPVLVDFGLASKIEDASGRDVLDVDVVTGGSARYMAPEQILGELLDPRCDLYALGCVLFELLTGRTPFFGKFSDVIDQHLRRPPPRVSTLASDIPSELEQLVHKLLIKERRDRLGYANDAARVLSRWSSVSWSRPAPASRTYLYRPPLVGRQSTLQTFQDMLQRLRDRFGALAFVRGESGVGKTRVALELHHLAAHLEIHAITGGCSPIGSESPEGSARTAPLEPLRPLLKAVADRCVEGGEAETTRLIGGCRRLLAPFEPSLLEVDGELGPEPVALPAAAARDRLCRSLFQTLSALTANEPLLLILDDMQWSDELTLAFLKYLAAGPVRELPVLVLVLARREELSAELSALAGLPAVVTFDLARLGPDEVACMVGGMLSLERVPADFAQFLSDKSEGNAFFVAEYLRAAVSAGVLVRDAVGQWQIAQTIEPTRTICDSLPLPHSLRQLVERRLLDLSASTREVLTTAATIGRQFDLGLLQAATASKQLDVFEALDQLVQRHIVEPVERGHDFRFVHDKLREIPYSNLSEAERQQAHRVVAAALESLNATGTPVESASLGYHWYEAGEPALSAPYLKDAAEAAVRLNALDRAIAQYGAAERAIIQLPSRHQGELAAVRESLGDVLFLRGLLEASKDAFTRALQDHPASSALDRARLQRKLGKACEIGHQHEQALLAFEAAERELRSAGMLERNEISEWIRIQRSRIWIYYWLARIEDMNAAVEALKPHIDADASHLDRADYFHALASSSYRASRYVVDSKAIEHARRSLQAAQEAGAPVEAAFGRFSLGFGLLFAGQLEAAEAELTAARIETRRLGDALNEIRCLAYLTLTHRRAGRIHDTRTLAQETLERASAANMGDYVGLAKACLAWVAYRIRSMKDAERLSRDALKHWEGLSFAYPFQWAGLITLLAVSDRLSIEESITLSRRMLDPRLAKLPERVEQALEAAIDVYTSGGEAAARTYLERAIIAAGSLGYL